MIIVWNHYNNVKIFIKIAFFLMCFASRIRAACLSLCIAILPVLCIEPQNWWNNALISYWGKEVYNTFMYYFFNSFNLSPNKPLYTMFK